jgi:anaerobic selenocysteine-containing dehydrogenase
MKYYRHVNWDDLDWASFFGFLGKAEPIVHQLYLEPMQKFRRAAPRAPAQHRARIARYFDPIPFWYPPLEDTNDGFNLHAITQRPMAMYHSWGSQNAWLRQIIGRNWLCMHEERARMLGIEDGDWVHVSSAHGQITCQATLMDGVNRDTVWTWNAIGKRAGAWALDAGAPEAKKGFLLNHLIADLLPEREGGYRYSNSDPITGQAAWYDLRVKIEKADAASMSAPQFETLRRVG